MDRPRSFRAFGGISIALALGLAGWSIMRLGLQRKRAVQEPFRKVLKHLSWAEVHARQEQRAFPVDAWKEALRLKAGAIHRRRGR